MLQFPAMKSKDSQSASLNWQQGINHEGQQIDFVSFIPDAVEKKDPSEAAWFFVESRLGSNQWRFRDWD